MTEFDLERQSRVVAHGSDESLKMKIASGPRVTDSTMSILLVDLEVIVALAYKATSIYEVTP